MWKRGGDQGRIVRRVTRRGPWEPVPDTQPTARPYDASMIDAAPRRSPGAQERTEWAVAVPSPGDSVAGLDNRGAHEVGTNEAEARRLSAGWGSPVIHRTVLAYPSGAQVYEPWVLADTQPEQAS